MLRRDAPFTFPGIGRGRRAITGADTVISTDRGTTIDATSGTFSLALTAAATLGSGFHCAVYSSGSGTVTIDPATTETIRTATGTASTIALTQGQGVVLMCDGSNWKVIASIGLPWSPSTPITVYDNAFTILDEADPTKTLVFSLGSMATGNDLTISAGAQTADRTLSIPVLVGSDTLMSLGTAQTVTGTKTFSSVDSIRASGSSGLILSNSSGTTVATFGPGPGTGTALAGGLTSASITATSASGITTLQASTQDAIALLGRAGGTSSYVATITPPTLAASITLTTPASTSILAASASALTSGRVPVVTTGGLLIDSANFTYSIASGQMLLNNASGAYSTWQHNATSVGDIGPANQITGGSTADFGISSRAGNLILGTNSVQRISMSTTAITVSSTIATSTFAATTASTSATTGAVVVTGGAGIGGAISAGTTVDVQQAVKIRGTTLPGTGAGMELAYNSGSNEAAMTSFDRTAVAYRDFGAYCASFRVRPSGTTALTIDGTAATFASATPVAITSTAVNGLALSGGVTVAKQVRLAQIAGTTTDGDTWHDSTQKALQSYINGIEQTLSGCIFTQTATRTIANTVTETSLFTTGVGTLTVPANFFLAGKTVRLTLTGSFADTGTPTVRLRLKYGSTTVIDSTALTLPAIGGTEEWRAVCELTCRTAGVSGTLAGSIWFLFDTTTGIGAINGFDIIPTTATVDTTASGALDLSWQWGAADPANTVSCVIASAEVIN